MTNTIALIEGKINWIEEQLRYIKQHGRTVKNHEADRRIHNHLSDLEEILKSLNKEI